MQYDAIRSEIVASAAFEASVSDRTSMNKVGS